MKTTQYFIAKAFDYVGDHGSWTTYFVIMYTLALFANGYYGYHFDTNDILFAYGVIAGKNLIGHGINSTLNSPRFKMPEPDEQVGDTGRRAPATKSVHTEQK